MTAWIAGALRFRALVAALAAGLLVLRAWRAAEGRRWTSCPSTRA